MLVSRRAFLGLLAAGAAAGLAACAGAPPRPAAVSLRIATWNLHDLFDEVADGGEQVLTAAQVARKLDRVGAVLRAIDADVIAVQEVENLGVLARLANGPLAGMGYRAHLVEGSDPRGIDVGLLARVPVTRYVVHGRGERLFTREPYEAHLVIAGREVVLVAAHLVSKRATSVADAAAREVRREKQARRLRQIADEAAIAAPAALVVVAGDLNDEPGSAPLAPLLADGAWVDAGARLDLEHGFTYRYKGRPERIDYLLVARGSAAAVARLQAWDPGRPPASDHRPLVVDFVLR